MKACRKCIFNRRKECLLRKVYGLRSMQATGFISDIHVYADAYEHGPKEEVIFSP